MHRKRKKSRLIAVCLIALGQHSQKLKQLQQRRWQGSLYLCRRLRDCIKTKT